MSKHLLEITIYLSKFYLLYCEITYLWFKYAKKDNRFKNLSIFKYIQYPIKTFKGD